MSLNELVKGKRKKGRKRREIVSRGVLCIENGRIQLSLPSSSTQKPFNQTTAIKPNHCTIPRPLSFALIHSFIHPFFLSSGALSLPIIISCPQTASVLVPVSAGLSNSPALISQLLQIKREVSSDYSKPSYERERKPTFHTQGE